MKILVLSFYFPPDLSAGSFRMKALVDQLISLPNIEVEIVTTTPNRYASFEIDLDTQEFKSNLTIYRIKLPEHKSGMIDQAKAFFSFYKKALEYVENEDYNLVFATSSRLFTAFLGARIANKKKLPLYLDIRDIFVDTLKDIINPLMFFFLKPVLNGVENYTFFNAKHINLVSKGFKGYFIERFKNPRYSCFTNGIDDEFIDCDFNGGFSYTNNKIKTIVYAGNIGEGQGLHKIIPMLAKKLSEDYYFIIVGDGGRLPALKNSIKNLKNVELIQPVKRTELKKFYSQADVLFLHLNNYSAFEKVLPSKIFEYAATGKPLLAGVAGYAAEFIESEVVNSAVFPPNNIEVALSVLKTLDLQLVNRSTFVDQYSRKYIMSEMALSIVNIRNSKQ